MNSFRALCCSVLVAASGRIMSNGLHPHVVSRAPSASARYRSFSTTRGSFDGMWRATREEIADWYLKNHASHIG